MYGYMDQDGKHQNNTKKLKVSLKKFAGETLLLAEDNEINRSIIIGLLAGTDIQIITAETGQEAVELIRDNLNINVVVITSYSIHYTKLYELIHFRLFSRPDERLSVYPVYSDNAML